jgi:histidyl-tRNA synthetase
MRDVLPAEVELRDQATATILEVYRRYGFRRVETPALESIRLLARSESGENEKLIFRVLKRGERLDLASARGLDDLVDLGLRFDLTVPLARYYAHNHGDLPQPLKAVQIGPVWRAERPQKGRFRQFTQCDIDILGVASPVAEVELILATLDALLALGIERPRLRLNDRRLLAALARRCGFPEAAHGSVFIALDKLDKIGLDAVCAEIRQVGHDPAAVDRLAALLAELTAAPASLEKAAAALASELPAAVVEGLASILSTVTGEAAGRYEAVFDPALVRGMGYYTGPIFEVAHGDYGVSIAGGGRYDRMIGNLLGRDVPACGFSIGFERIVDILGRRPEAGGARRKRVAFVFDESADPRQIVAEAGRLRATGDIVSLEVRRRNFRQQLADLARWGYDWYVVFPVEGGGSPQPRPIEARTDG